MPTILHISDLHFGETYVERVGEALSRFIRQQKADLIVISGDLTENSLDHQFIAARQFLKSLPSKTPLIVIPGNHDIPQLPRWRDLSTPFRRYKTYISDQLDQTLVNEHFAVVALNSTTWFGSWIQGWISKKQLEICKQVFSDASPLQLKVFVTHHHLAPTADYEGGGVMHRSKAIMRTLQTYNVDVVLGGHLHRCYIGNSLDFYPGLDRLHGITIVQSGTTTSRRGRAREKNKNSFNIIEVNTSAIEIYQMMYFDEIDEFAAMGTHRYPRAPAVHLSSDRLDKTTSD